MDPRFGTEAQLKELADGCQKRGIRLLLDVVYNHAGYDSNYLTDRRPGAGPNGERGNVRNDDVSSCVAGLPDLKTELPEVDEYLFQAHLGWRNVRAWMDSGSIP